MQAVHGRAPASYSPYCRHNGIQHCVAQAIRRVRWQGVSHACHPPHPQLGIQLQRHAGIGARQHGSQVEAVAGGVFPPAQRCGHGNLPGQPCICMCVLQHDHHAGLRGAPRRPTTTPTAHRLCTHGVRRKLRPLKLRRRHVLAIGHQQQQRHAGARRKAGIQRRTHT